MKLFFRTLLFAITTCLLVIVASSCNEKRMSQIALKSTKINGTVNLVNNENFDSFIKVFFTQKDFQFNRILFPVVNLVYDIDTKIFVKNIIKKEEWSFWNIYKQKKVILKVIEGETGEHILNAQIKETGVSVNYVFSLKDSKWYLVKIIDEST
ncbi:MAG: hypothetical protein V4643_12465 [Bacteroidota bacterium]